MVKAADKAGIVRGVIKKNRNGSPDLDIAFKIGSHRVGQDIDGEPVYAPICLPCDPGQADDKVKLTDAERAAHDLFLEMAADGPVDQAEWRKRATDEYHVSASEERDNRRRAVTRAFKGLLTKGEIATGNGLLTFPYAVETDDFDDDVEGANH